MLEHLKKIANFKNLVIYFFVHAAILIAIVFLVIRLSLPSFENNLPHLEKLASEGLGMDIKVQSMETGWQGLGPSMRFEDVTLFNSTSHELIAQVHYFDVALDLFASLLHWKLLPESLTFEGVNLTVEQQPNGEFRLKNHALFTDRPLTDSLEFLLSKFKKLEIKNADLDVKFNTGAIHKIHLDYMRFFPRKGDYRFEAELRRPQTTGKLTIISDIKGDLNQLDLALIDGYIKISDLKYDSQSMPWKFSWIKPLSGEVNVNTWFKWNAGQWEELIGRVSLKQMILQNTAYPEVSLPINVDAKIAWQDLGDNLWRLSGDKIVLKLGTEPSPESSFILEGGAQGPWNLRVNTVALNDVLDLLTLSNQLDPKARSAISQLKPHGELRDLQWIGTRVEQGCTDWRLGLKLDQLQWQAYEKIPAISNVSGEIKLSEDQGQLSLNSQNVAVDMPNFFDTPLVFSTVEGLFAWTHDTEWIIQSQHLSLVNPDLELDASLSVVIPENTQDTVIDLVITSGEFNQTILKKYLPTKAFPPGLIQWIKQSIEQARITSTKTVIKGPVKSFPYKNGGGEFDMRFSLEDVDLRYHQQWPPVQNLSGELVMEGNGLQAYIDKGMVFDNFIKPSKISLLYAQFPDPLVLHLSGEVEGSAENAEKFLRASPLWKTLGSTFELVKVKGNLLLDIKTDIPLRSAPNQFKIEGTANLTAGTLLIDKWKLALDQVNGKLDFTQNTLNAESIQGSFMGRPGVLSASTEIKKGENEITWNFHSMMDKALIQHFAKSHYWNYLEGQSEYDARFILSIPKRAEPLALTLIFSLKGMALNLPAPLAKNADQELPTSIALTFLENDFLGVNFDLGNRASGAMTFNKTNAGYALKNAQLVAGDTHPQVTRPLSGIQITGHTPTLLIQPWADFLDKHAQLYPPTPNESSPEITFSQLRVDDLQYKDWHINHATVNAHLTQDYWMIDLSSDQMSGNLQFPRRWGAQPFLLDLSHCTWPLGKSAGKMNTLTPKDVRPIDFQCKQFNYKKSNIGQIHVGIVPHVESGSVIFDPILLESAIDKFTASGTWGSKEGKLVSAFNGKATSSNVGTSLRAWGIPTDVEDAKGEGEFTLNWLGSPTDLSLKTLSGELDVRMQNGRFIGVNPGFGRMLGLLSFQGLQRRMRLDFSDVFKEGFAFDTFKSNISIRSGNAYTTKASIKAPAADISFSGRTGLVSHDLDFDMLVQAHIDSTVPAAAVAIANPAAGAAVWIVDKVFNPLGSVTRYRYHVTGNWETPVFTDLTKEYRQELDGPAKVEEAQ